MIFHAYYLINLYFSRDITTVITLGYDYLDFPSITICNVNPFVTNKINETSQEMADFLVRIKPVTAEDEANMQVWQIQ